MSDATPDRAWAGRTVFPRSTTELRSTTICPACLTPLTATVCASCGLDLRHPAAADLATSSAAIADALDARLDLIGRIRRETAAAVFPTPESAGTAAAQAPAAEAPATPAQSAPVQPVPTPTEQAAGSARGRSGIQIALIVVGITLLSVFAVFGLVYAFVTYGADVRMAIIIGGTLATMIAAGALGRRGLRSTAEGVAVLGTVMLTLDAWALRLNEPEGLGATDPELYWGIALLIVGATAAAWARTSRLVAPGVAAAGILPVGAALLVGQIIDSATPVTGASLFAGAIAGLVVAAVAGVAAPDQPGARRAAAIFARAAGAVAAMVALAAMIDLDAGERFTPVLAGGLLTGATLLHVIALTRGPLAARRGASGALVGLDRATLVALGAGAALAAMVGAVVSAARFDQERVAVSAPLLAAVLVAVAAEQAWRRLPLSSAARTASAAATLTATALASLAGGLAAIVGAGAFLEAATQSLETLPLGPGDRVASVETATIAALGALALSLGIIAAGWAALGVLVRRARALTAIAAVVIVAAVPLLPTWWLVLAVLALVAIGAAASVPAVQRIADADARRALLALCAPLSTGAAIGAVAISWAVPRGAGLGLAAALVAVALGRDAVRTPVVRAVATGGAAALVLVSAAPLVAELLVTVPGLTISRASTVIAVAAVIIVSAQLGRLSVMERHTAQTVAAGAAVLAALIPDPALPGGPLPGGALLDEAAALALGIAALALVGARGERIARVVARILLPFATALAVALAVRDLASGPLSPTSPDAASGVTPAVATATAALGALAVVAAASLLAASRTAASADTDTSTTAAAMVGAPDGAADDGGARARRRHTLSELTSGAGSERRAGDLAILVAALGTLSTGLSASAEGAAWLPLLLAALVVLVVAISRDGLIGAASPRRHLGWIALALAAGALWTRLAASDVTAPEPYTLPVTGALLLIAAAAHRAARRRTAGASTAPARSVAPLVAAAAGLALLPSALHEPLTEPLRGALVAVVAIAALLGGMLAPARLAERLPGIGAALAAAGAATLALGSVGHALALTADATGAIDRQAAPLAGGALAHAVITVALPAALAVAGQLLGEGRVRDGVVAALLGSAAIAAVMLGQQGAVATVELVSVPVAIAALAVGALALAERPAARSWLWLAPGIVLLLGPSLLAIDGAGEPQWRAVVVGLAAAAVFVVGLLRRLQAPFVLGGAALLVHLFVQSWPLLEQVGRTVEWWLWLGLAGVLIVAVAARYERRLQNARDLARRISELR